MKRNSIIDGSKGIAMIIIVIVHSFWIVMGTVPPAIKGAGTLGALNVFFALSAYLMEMHGAPTMHGYIRRILKLCGWLFCFSALFCIVEQVSIAQMLERQFMGYWFFAALLVCYAIGNGVRLLGEKYHFGQLLSIQIYIGLWIIIWSLSVNMATEIACVPLNDIRMYFPSYIIGMMLARYSKMKRIVSHPLTVLITGAIWLYIIATYNQQHGEIYYLGGILALPLVWKLSAYMGRYTKFPALVGKKSLWIYGYHYFILLIFRAAADGYEDEIRRITEQKVWLEYCIVGVITIITIMACLLAGGITKAIMATISQKISGIGFRGKEKLLNLWSK